MKANIPERSHLTQITVPDDTKIGDRIPIKGFAIITKIAAPTTETFNGKKHTLEVGEPSATYRLDLENA